MSLLLFMKRKVFWISFLIACLLVVALVLRPQYFPGGETLRLRMRGQATITDRLNQYGPAARSRLAPYFQKAGLLYPPRQLELLGLKEEKRLEIYAADADRKVKFIRAYKVLAASGKAGPKLREGDYQVPEGFYKIEALNPNSAFHLALRVNYPNEFDRQHAAQEGRKELGGDIMIHGSNASVGCLAVGDPAAEELFIVAADTGLENIEVLLCPTDFRKRKVFPASDAPIWTAKLYDNLSKRVLQLPQLTKR